MKVDYAWNQIFNNFNIAILEFRVPPIRINRDDGPGIPTENLEKIFDSLFTTKSSGTGLGLAYCKSVVEQHGGSITASTDPTTFTIYLPREIISIPTKETEFTNEE